MSEPPLTMAEVSRRAAERLEAAERAALVWVCVVLGHERGRRRTRRQAMQLALKPRVYTNDCKVFHVKTRETWQRIKGIWRQQKVTAAVVSATPAIDPEQGFVLRAPSDAGRDA